MLAELFLFSGNTEVETQTTISYKSGRVVKNASRVLLFSGNTEVGNTNNNIIYNEEGGKAC